jgi:hypothetical protein
MFCSNCKLAPVSDSIQYLAPVYLQSSPYNFKTLYLFNRNSVLSDFYAKRLVETKPI